MPASQKPRIDLEETDSSVLAEQLEELAKKLGIDLSLADDGETQRVLDKLERSLSDEIVETREKNTE